MISKILKKQKQKKTGCSMIKSQLLKVFKKRHINPKLQKDDDLVKNKLKLLSWPKPHEFND